MPGHHSSPVPVRRARFRRFLLPFTVAVVAGTGVIVANAANSTHCTGELPLRVAVTPAVQPVAQEVADAYALDGATVNGQCVKVQVVVAGSADVVQTLPTRPIDPPALWIPDSSLWAATAKQQEAKAPDSHPVLDPHSSLASSPLVLVASPRRATELGWPDASISWQRLVDGTAPFVIGDPLTTTEGVTTLAVTQGLSTTSPQNLIAIMLKIRKSTLDDVDRGFDNLRRDSANAPMFTATEQSVVAHNSSSSPTTVEAIYPSEGSPLFDYPVVRVTTGGEPAGTDQAAASFERELRSARSMGLFSAAGFRDSKGVASASWGGKGGVRSATPQLLSAPTADQVLTVLRAWSVVNLDGRTLAVVDTSGSMTDPMPDGQTRIEVARDGALAALALMPDTTSVGLWTFSLQQTPPNDWTELVPVGPLGGQSDGVTQRQALQVAGTSLPTRTGGGTGLYDTAFAAYETLRDGFDPTKVNTEVLITDGKNEKDGGMDLPTLLQNLRAKADPTRPVQIIGIGLGPDADMDVLNQIAAATGGKAYQALDGATFRAVLFDAFSRRPCRTSTC